MENQGNSPRRTNLAVLVGFTESKLEKSAIVNHSFTMAGAWSCNQTEEAI